MDPTSLPEVRTTRLFIAWHETTYADSIWIGLIQYIGDNIMNGKFVDFVGAFAWRITELHPHFLKPYNIALILTPKLDDTKPEYEKNKRILTSVFALGERGIRENCDPRKLELVRQSAIEKALWESEAMANTCRDDMLAYNIAYVAGALWEHTKSEYYYKLASTQREWPQASRFLAVLATAKEWDHRSAAEKFLLWAIEGYDEYPLICQSSSVAILQKLKHWSLRELVETLPWVETSLTAPQDTNNPLAKSSTNCYNSALRALKQLYLAYITEITVSRPELTTGDDIIRAGLLSSLPTLEDQKGFTVKKEKGIWNYRLP
jgi:hypothetical protein